MHNSFIGCYQRVGLRSLDKKNVGALYSLVWFRVGLGLNITSMIMQTFEKNG